MIDIYGLMAFPLAALLQSLFQVRSASLMKPLALVLILSLTYINYFQIEQFNRNIIHWDSMTFEAYKATFMEDERPDKYDSLIAKPDYEQALNHGDQ